MSRAFIELLTLRLLGTHVGRGPQNETGNARRHGHSGRNRIGECGLAHSFRQPEVQDLYPAVCGQLDIAWLEIEVNHSLVVHRLEALRNLDADPQGFANLDTP
jgi:hypothetical protein